MSTNRVIVVANRLPVHLRLVDGKLVAERSSGGLVAALGGVIDSPGFAWVGWPGAEIPEDKRAEADALLAAQRLVPVHLTLAQEDLFYRRACNEMLWPLCHYFVGSLRFDPEAWRNYVDVNRMFADAVLAQCEEPQPDGDTAVTVWVHDYQLMLVPGMLRERRPDLAIGFFLHIPFPSSEVYRLLPVRAQILQGLLGADYVAFHTSDYALHFRHACLRVLGLAADEGGVEYEGRRVAIGVHPIGIDVQRFAAHATAPATLRSLADLQARYGERRVILNVERLDYTKGIQQKLAAFERFLEIDPRRAQQVTYLQIIVPSRLTCPDYQDLKRQIEETIGRINGRHGGPGVVPIEYLHRSVPIEELIALYRFAHVGFVTPVRDGMNLVAQEFVYSQEDQRGMLVLSEFAGAAHSLTRAILVNPWDIDQMADALAAALALTASERRERMAPMRRRVEAMNCRTWAQDFLQRLQALAENRRQRERSTVLLRRADPDLIERFREAPFRHLFLDYDGTLRELTRNPDEAAPTPEILQMLRSLAGLPSTAVHLVSGRRQEEMDRWFGGLPVHLCAEHGLFVRPVGQGWERRIEVDLAWMPQVREMLDRLALEVPGALVEEKHAAIAWHYRLVDFEYGRWRARELQNTLQALAANQPIEVVHGNRVIELRAIGVHKGTYVRAVLASAGDQDFVLCIGSDRADADMFRVLPAHAFAVQVGVPTEHVRYVVKSPARVRTLLRELLSAGQAVSTSA